MVSVGLSMLNEPYATAAKTVALEQADSYDGFEGGHTGNFTNVMWRALSVPNVPDDKRHHYRRHQDKLRWYYELCRQPNGGFRMLPVVDPAGEMTARQILAHSLGLAVVSLLPALLGRAGTTYLVGAALLSAMILFCAVRFYRQRPRDGAARLLFRASLVHLPLLMGLLLLESPVLSGALS